MIRRHDPFAVRRARKVAPSTDAKSSSLNLPPAECVVAVPGRSEQQLLVVAKAARALAGEERPVLALSSHSPEALSAHAVDLVVREEPEVLPAVWMTLCPYAIILPEDGGRYSDLGRRLAVDLELSIAVHVVAIGAGLVWSATNLPGKEVVAPLPRILLVDRRISAPAATPRVTREAVLPPLCNVPEGGPRLLRTIEPEPERTALPNARFVVAAGAGVRDLGLFHRFVNALGATPGASRNLVDSGQMPRDRQIGTSGERIAADVYVALGISGAVQHLEGIDDCQCVIAVNTDSSCPMAARADLTLRCDAETFMHRVLAHLDRRK